MPSSALDLAPDGLCMPSMVQLHAPRSVGVGLEVARRAPAIFPGLRVLSGDHFQKRPI
ncbi:hypothetical protein AB0I68_32295 [Streptomyces sp. NPDC050448]|uniref:hypothetical protein n=1 Tax=Streptomyces sp. NPDC050448 TaxID=3155404 RepID=UPI003429468A